MNKQGAIDALTCFPYWNLDDKWLWGDEMQKLSEIAISAIEKQIPERPVKIYTGRSRYYFACPICKQRRYSCEKYCPECGQSLDWDD